MNRKVSSTLPPDHNENSEILYVVKIGGNVIDDQNDLYVFLQKFSIITERKILVHGGGKIATSIGDKLGITSNYVDGRRITDDETIDLVTMVYGGLVNKKITAALQALNCNAIGISGADANALPAQKRPVKSIDYGWVGDIRYEQIDPTVWQLFLDNKLVPVVAPLTHDVKGHILNTNADTIASAIAVRLSKLYHVKLIYCFEKNGILNDANDESSAIEKLDIKTYKQLKENKKLTAGILPKIDNAFDAIKNGVHTVLIGNSNHLTQLVNEESGTKIFL